MPEEQTQVTTQSSQSGQGQSTSQGAAGATGASTQGSTATQTTSTQTVQTQGPSRPDWLPEQFFDAAKGPKFDEFGQHYSEMATAWAAEQVRRNALPQKVEDVQIGLPKDFQLPQGIEFKIDPAKPEFAKLQALAVKHGWSQDAVTDAVGVYAETLVGSESTRAAAHAAEVAKLGANGPARVTALETFFKGIGSPELMGMLVTAPIVQAAERLVAKFASQGVARFSQNGREPGTAGGKVSDETYNAMSQAQKLDYARQFDQSQFQKTA